VSPRRAVSLARPLILGILNVTPDSFSDGGQLTSDEHAADVALRMIQDGADGVDVGGESTRPGAEPVAWREQIKRTARVIALIRRAQARVRPLITIDTTSSRVAAAALDAGADAINDVSAGTDDRGMFRLAGERACGLVLMHRLAKPREDAFSHSYGKAGAPAEPRYGDVVHEVGEFLARRAVDAMKAGVRTDAIVLDPGLGFGKTVAQNLELIRRTSELACLGYPIMSALSRKSFVAKAAMSWGDKGGVGETKPNRSKEAPELPPPSERLHATLALSARHLATGARIFRVHDVRPHVEALRAAWATHDGR